MKDGQRQKTNGLLNSRSTNNIRNLRCKYGISVDNDYEAVQNTTFASYPLGTDSKKFPFSQKESRHFPIRLQINFLHGIRSSNVGPTDWCSLCSTGNLLLVTRLSNETNEAAHFDLRNIDRLTRFDGLVHGEIRTGKSFPRTIGCSTRFTIPFGHSSVAGIPVVRFNVLGRLGQHFAGTETCHSGDKRCATLPAISYGRQDVNLLYGCVGCICCWARCWTHLQFISQNGRQMDTE